MNTQSIRGVIRLADGQALHLGRLGGDLVVVDGRVWLTCDGDLGDHVVEPGQTIRLAVDENAVIEPAHRSATVTVRWSARKQSFVGALAEEPLRGLAFLTGLAARAFTALARGAAAGASRAQGCIDTGDTMASLGALK